VPENPLSLLSPAGRKSAAKASRPNRVNPFVVMVFIMVPRKKIK